jgi:hypothetical protein
MTETAEQRIARVIDKALDLVKADQNPQVDAETERQNALVEELTKLQAHPSANFARIKEIGQELGWDDNKKAIDAVRERLKKFAPNKQPEE